MDDDRSVRDALRTALVQPDIKERFDALALSTRSMSPQELKSFIYNEQQLWKPVIKQIGLATP